MKVWLKNILLLLTVFLYLASALELDRKERVQNFEKESHSFVISKANNHFELTNIIADIPQRIFQLVVNEEISQQSFLFSANATYSPPERLHLLHSVFLI